MTTPETFCCNLCNAVKTILDSMAETYRFEQATDYAVLFSKSILVTTTKGCYFPKIEFVLYQSPNSSIKINTEYVAVIGYVNGCKVIELPINEDLNHHMLWIVSAYAEYLEINKELQIVQKDSNSYTIDILA